MSSKDEEHVKPTQGTNGKEGEQQSAQGKEEGDHKGLFDQPLIMDGKRKRKSTEHFAFATEKKKESAGKYAGGSGCSLGDIAFVEYQISQHKGDELKLLHRLCYDRQGAKTEIKKNLRNFNGWQFVEESEQQKKKRTAIEKFSVGGLKRVALLLGLPRSGSKDDLCDAIMGFLMKPVDNGKAPPSKSSVKRRKSSSGGKGRRRSKKQKVSDSEEEEEEEIEMEEDDDDDEEQEEEMDQEADEEEEADEEGNAKQEEVADEEKQKEDKEDKQCSPDEAEPVSKTTPTKSQEE